ncbi:hypothetical protein ACL02U_11805 [Streptomyces sp. MS06]|uniref:hypothetical protein n=1 Tax=Streptomyces sp. MS06 TaxID=3385974 RepID=UPI0039A02A11
MTGHTTTVTHYAVRIPDGRVLEDGTPTSRSEQETRLARYRESWPDAVLVRRDVTYSTWMEVTS